MITLDIYLLLSIIGITIISLYVNIFTAVKIYNKFRKEDHLDSMNNAIEGLHLENMNLIEEVAGYKKRLKEVNNDYYRSFENLPICANCARIKNKTERISTADAFEKYNKTIKTNDDE